MSSSASMQSSYSRGDCFHNQPPPRLESVAMATQAYLVHSKAPAKGQFVDIGMRKHRSFRGGVNGGVSAGKAFCKCDILARKVEIALPGSGTSLPVSEKAPKIAPPRPARHPGLFGVSNEPIRRNLQDSDRTINIETRTRNRILRAVGAVAGDPGECRKRSGLRGQDGFF